MKIVLTAFNKKMFSKVMDVPDNTSSDFFLPMPMDILAHDPKKEVLNSVGARAKRGYWRRTGYNYHLKDLGVNPIEGENEYAAEYCLVDIS